MYLSASLFLLIQFLGALAGLVVPAAAIIAADASPHFRAEGPTVKLVKLMVNIDSMRQRGIETSGKNSGRSAG